MHKLDIVIPVYNEGDKIVKVVEALTLFVKTPFRILICYDRDDDDTLPALLSINNPPNMVRVKNEGKGAHGAVMTGFKASTAPCVIVFPADDLENGRILDDMVEKFHGGASIVAASRFMRGGSMKGCPWLKAFLVRSQAFFLYHVVRLPVHDSTNGFRLFSRKVIEKIPVESTQGFAFSIELLVKAQRLGEQIAEVPSKWMERESGQSRFRVIKWLPMYLRWFFYALGTSFLRHKHL